MLGPLYKNIQRACTIWISSLYLCIGVFDDFFHTTHGCSKAKAFALNPFLQAVNCQSYVWHALLLH